MGISKSHDDYEEHRTWEEGSEEWEREREEAYADEVDRILHDPDWDREKCGWNRVTGIRPEDQ